ncbi:hypothetical protein C8Q73DRAFT_363956 [Cubamyces lactineus]|nr:hypothetical protein C8Q73DRAFT_363956 [Cubamyces lactineus]
MGGGEMSERASQTSEGGVHQERRLGLLCWWCGIRGSRHWQAAVHSNLKRYPSSLLRAGHPLPVCLAPVVFTSSCMSIRRPRAHNTKKSARRFYNTTFSSTTRKTTPRRDRRHSTLLRPVWHAIASACNEHQIPVFKSPYLPVVCGEQSKTRRCLIRQTSAAGILTSNGPAFKSCASPILSAAPRRPPRYGCRAGSGQVPATNDERRATSISIRRARNLFRALWRQVQRHGVRQLQRQVAQLVYVPSASLDSP